MRLPSKDCSVFLLQYVLCAQNVHNRVISVRFCFGMDKVLFMVSICIPKQVTELLGETSFLLELSKFKSWSSFNKN